MATAPPPPDLPPVPPSAETLAKLPPGSAAVFVVHAAAVGGALAAAPEGKEILHEITRRLGVDSPEALLSAVGVDARRSILGALVPASEKSARVVVDAMAADGAPKAMEKLLHDHAGDATRMRLLVPLANGTDPARAAAVLVKALARGAPMEACPGAAACAGFGADAPLGVARGERAAVVAYADGPDLRVDVALPLFALGTDPGVLSSLVPFRGARGGFAGRCSRFDASAVMSLCLDARPTGEMGATTGYGMTVQALSGAAIDPPTRRKIAVAGRAESQQNLALAAPARRLADDGTLVVTARGDHLSALATWALTDASRPAIEKAFAAERCAAGHAVTAELVPALRAAFGDPGPGFSDPKKTVEAFKEAGWGAFAVALAGTWPNLLDAITSAMGHRVEVPAGIQVCARHEAGRLVLSIR